MQTDFQRVPESTSAGRESGGREWNWVGGVSMDG